MNSVGENMSSIWYKLAILAFIYFSCIALKASSEENNDEKEAVHFILKADDFDSPVVPTIKLSSEIPYTNDIKVKWTPLSQPMKQVDTGITPYVWATDLNDDVYYLNGSRFEKVPGKLMHVSSGEAGIWGVDSQNMIFFREGVDRDHPTGSKWKTIKGKLWKIDSGPTSTVCGITVSFKPFCRIGITDANPIGTKWQRISGQIKYISCGDYGCWAVNKYNSVFFTLQVAGWSTKWIKIGCSEMVQIEVGPNGQVWALNAYNKLFARIGVNQNAPSGISWKKIEGKNFTSITIGNMGKIYGVDAGNTVYIGSIVQEQSPGSQINMFGSGHVLMNAAIKRCLAPDSLRATEGTRVIHTSECTDSSALFRVLNSGAIQHLQSGLCIHLSGNRECPQNKELAILKRDCSNPRYFFKYTGKGFRLRRYCLRPTNLNSGRTTLTIYSYDNCNSPETTYKLIDIVKGCDLQCLEDIKSQIKSTNSFDEFFKISEAEVKSLAPGFSKFISTLEQEVPELHKDLLSTFFPVDSKVVENLEILMNRFGIEKMKAYPSLFLATAFIRRNIGVNASNPAVCGGTGMDIGGEPAIDEDDAEYKLSLSQSELASLLDEEDYRAQQAIDKEREKDERSGINTTEYEVSAVQQLIDRLEGKYYYKFWTAKSLRSAMESCQADDESEIKFPPRGDGMSGIEYLEYLFSRDPALLPKKNLKLPWPLAVALNIQTSVRQCYWIWRRLENGEKIVRYSKYTHDYNKRNVRCKASDWNPCSVPRIIEDGGVCGRQSTLARVTNHCLGIASGAIKQPAHAAGYRYTNSGSSYKFEIFQGITNIMNTYAVWDLVDNQYLPKPKLNAEYHKGLVNAMNYGYESYRDSRIALLIFSRIYDAKLRQESRDLLVQALEGNPHMMDVWMKLIHDVTGSNALPIERDDVFARIPNKCPKHFQDSLRNRLIVVMNKHLKNYMQMYLEVLFRLISPPTCCSNDQPQYLDILRSAWSNEQRELVKEYLFDGYISCAAESASIREVVEIIQKKIVSKAALLKLDVLSELLRIIQSAASRDEAKVEENKKILINFFTVACDVFPKIHVTASAWNVHTHYRACVKMQLEFLNNNTEGSLFNTVFVAWENLQNYSAKPTKTWNEYHLKNWLYGRTGDIIPLLVGVKESVDGGLIRERKVNIARNKTTALSSTWTAETTSERAVDGNADNLVAGESCAVTKKQSNPWFQLDLQKSTKVYGLLITNADANVANAFRKFEIHIGDNLERNGVTNPTCGNLHSIRRSQTRAFYCDPPLVGQYITINVLATNQVLAICEIAVYGSELASYRTNGVKLDIWYNIPTKSIQQLYDDSRYPENPDLTSKLATFDYQNRGDSYGGRLSAVYQPTMTGNHTFYVACTDECDVFLRDGESGDALQKIISLKKATKYQDWNASLDQRSLPIYLEKENLYELVATLKENAGRDYITVAVESPSGKFQAPIPAKQLFIDTKEESIQIMA